MKAELKTSQRKKATKDLELFRGERKKADQKEESPKEGKARRDRLELARFFICVKDPKS